jgi:ParB family chromosome partitioning protein
MRCDPPSHPTAVAVGAIIAKPPRRQVDTTTVETLATSISRLGLLHPITVRAGDDGNFILVAGLHRLQAFRDLGREHIPAFVLPASTTDTEARMAEIAENLHRAELTALERAEQIDEWRELAKGRKLSDPLNSQPHDLGNSQAARELGVDEKAVRNASKVASITPEAKEAARNAGIADNQSKLLKVANTKPEHQVEVVQELAGRVRAPRPQRDSSQRANHQENIRIRTQLWAHLKAALDNIRHLPRPEDVAVHMRAHGRSAQIDEGLPVAFSWLNGFQNEWNAEIGSDHDHVGHLRGQFQNLIAVTKKHPPSTFDNLLSEKELQSALDFFIAITSTDQIAEGLDVPVAFRRVRP